MIDYGFLNSLAKNIEMFKKGYVFVWNHRKGRYELVRKAQEK